MEWSCKMIEKLLRKKDVVEKVGLPKSTVSDWIEDFKIYIPTVKQNNVTYYRPEAVKLLLEVKEMRGQHYLKDQIHQIFQDKGYTIQIEAVEKSAESTLNNTQNELPGYMTFMGHTLKTLAEQEHQLKYYGEEVSKLKCLYDEQQKQIKKQEAIIQVLKEDMETNKRIANEVISRKKWWKIW